MFSKRTHDTRPDVTQKQSPDWSGDLSDRSGPENSLCLAIPPRPRKSVRNIVLVLGMVRPGLSKPQWTDFLTDSRSRSRSGETGP